MYQKFDILRLSVTSRVDLQTSEFYNFVTPIATFDEKKIMNKIVIFKKN